jgi:hypothetical protein
MKILSCVITVVMLAFAQQSMAADKSIYYGDWEGKAGDNQIEITLSKKKVRLIIGGTTVSRPIKFEYTYSNISPYPFLSILFTDEKENEHLLYVAIGTETKSDKAKLSGFYEKSRIIPDSHGRMESVSEKLEVIQKDK